MTAAEVMAGALLQLVEREQRPPCGDRSGSGRWTSEDRAERTQAVGLCQHCPLLDACHDLAAEIRPSFGVWAAHDFSPRPLRGRAW
jgi:hypothetical protein